MTSETSKVRSRIKALSSALSDLELDLEPLFAQSLPETLTSLETIQQAKLQTAIPYVVYDLIFMYLKTQGIDPKTHPVISELDRIKQYFQKIQDAENPPKRATVVDKAAASRFIQHAISQAQLQKDQTHWKKTAAEEDASSGSDASSEDEETTKPSSSHPKTSLVNENATPPAFVVPVKVTSKILERQRYEEKLKKEDEMNEGQESDSLEVFDGDEPKEAKMNVDESKPSEKSKGKEKSNETNPVVAEETSKVSKRRRLPMDPFAGYGDNDTYSPRSTRKRKSSESSDLKKADPPQKQKAKKKKIKGTS